jgi:uncharacterized protein (TIGR02246 family)
MHAWLQFAVSSAPVEGSPPGCPKEINLFPMHVSSIVRNTALAATAALIIGLLGTQGAVGAEKLQLLSNDAERAALKALVQTQTDAWNRGDAKAFAARFAVDGSFTNVVGMAYSGRDAFAQRHAEILQTIFKGSVLKQSIDKIRFVRPDVAIVDLNTEMTGFVRAPPGVRTEPDNVIRTKLEMVLLKEHGEWWISAYHNVAVTPLPTSR